MSNAEAELAHWQELVDRLHDLRKDPDADPREVEALAHEVGIFAKAPKDGWLAIRDGKVVYRDFAEGDRERDGAWVYVKPRPFQ